MVAPLHDRMPVILSPDVYGAWLDRSLTMPGEVLELLEHERSRELVEHEVSRRVNDVKNDDPSLVEPVEKID